MKAFGALLIKAIDWTLLFSHTLASSETPNGVSLFQAVFLVVFLVQPVHVLRDHFLPQVIRELIRRGLEEIAIFGYCPKRCCAQETVKHHQEQVRGTRAESCHFSVEMKAKFKKKPKKSKRQTAQSQTIQSRAKAIQTRKAVRKCCTSPLTFTSASLSSLSAVQDLDAECFSPWQQLELLLLHLSLCERQRLEGVIPERWEALTYTHVSQRVLGRARSQKWRSWCSPPTPSSSPTRAHAHTLRRWWCCCWWCPYALLH